MATNFGTKIGFVQTTATTRSVIEGGGLVVARDRVSDSERVSCFGGVIFYFLKFFSVRRFFDVPGPIFAKLCHTTRYMLK